MAACLSCPSDPLPISKVPFSSTFSSPKFDPFPLLRTCTNPNHLTQIHAQIIRRNLANNPPTAAHLLRLYSSYARINCAAAVFRQLRDPSTFTWNLMIKGYTANARASDALALFNHMLVRGVSPDKFTFPFVTKACAELLAVDMGKVVHGFAIKTGDYSRDMYIKNTQMDFYLKCGELECARKLFDKMSVRNVVSWTTMLAGLIGVEELESAKRVFEQMPERNVVSWTAMINGYATNGKIQEAFELFWEMQVEGVRPNEFTLVILLGACAELGSVKLGAWVHDFALKNGFKLGVYLGTALIDMYSKCGCVKEARKVFHVMEKKSLATWNSMITSLGVHGCGEEALGLFEEMIMEENVEPDAITFVGVLCACVQTHNADGGLKYFEYMMKCCEIMPILDHYICMFQLWGYAKMLQGDKR